MHPRESTAVVDPAMSNCVAYTSAHTASEAITVVCTIEFFAISTDFFVDGVPPCNVEAFAEAGREYGAY